MLNQIEEIESPAGLPIYYIGPPLKEGPLPALFYFSLSGKDSLQLDPFNQPVNYLKDSPVRIFSFTLPGHGDGLKNSEAISFWASAFAQGENPVKTFIDKARANIDALIHSKIVDEKRLVVAGLSRGGYIATLLAATEKRIQAVLGFAPMIHLEISEEFKKFPTTETVLQESLEAYIPQLVGTPLHFYIGNRDILVSTDACYQFIRKLTETSYSAGIRSPQVGLTLNPSIGAKGHGTAPATFLDGVTWLKKQLRME